MTISNVIDVLSIGEPLIEFSHGSDGLHHSGFGGDVMNVAVAVSRLGGRSALASKIGRDDWGKELKQFLIAEKVCTNRLEFEDQKMTGSYQIHYSEQGHSFSYDRQGSAASQWAPMDASKLNIDDATIVHFSGITQAISNTCKNACKVVLEKARKAGKTISYDPNFRPKLCSLEEAQKNLRTVLQFNPILLPGLDDSKTLTGLENPFEIVRHFQKNGAQIVAMTAGDDGIFLGTTNLTTHIPGIPANVVDASGAGDCFDGAFLYRISEGDTPYQAACFANVAASLSVSMPGAASSYPFLDSVKNRLAELS